MKTLAPTSNSSERGGAVALVAVIVVIVLLLMGTATLFLGASRSSASAASAVATRASIPAPSPTFSLSWEFTKPKLEALEGRWSITTDVTLTAADPVLVKDMEVAIVRGARRVRGEVTTGPPSTATNECALAFDFDEVPGAVAPSLEVRFTAVMADGVVTQHRHVTELSVE